MTKYVLITGADQGLGFALKKKFESRKYGVFSVGQKELLKCRSYEELESLVSSYINSCEGVINNYGINHLNWIKDEEDKNIEEIFRINYYIPFWITKLCAIKNKPMNIINISSIASRVPQRCTSIYCSSKAALNQLTKVSARELSEKGFKIIAVLPGKIEGTEMTRKTEKQVYELRGWSKEQAANYEINLLPIKRNSNLSEMSEAIWGIYNLPQYATGSIIEIAGGL